MVSASVAVPDGEVCPDPREEHSGVPQTAAFGPRTTSRSYDSRIRLDLVAVGVHNGE